MKRDDSAELERLRAEVGSLRERVATLEALLKCDALTGLGNRRAFDECLTIELERTARSGKPSCLLLLDIDGLKTLNDNFSHAAGDAASVVGIINSSGCTSIACESDAMIGSASEIVATLDDTSVNRVIKPTVLSTIANGLASPSMTCSWLAM